MMEKLLFIYNPHAGKGQIDNNISKLIKFYTSHDVLLTLYPTKKKGDGAEFIKKIDLDEFDKLVVSGGDGTFSEIAEAVAKKSSSISIGYIPLGSTNDLARSSDLPSDILEAAEITLSGKVTKRDMGLFNGKRLFTYVAAFGLFTNVTYTTSQNLKNILGYSAYILEGAKSLFPIPSYSLTVKSDGKEIEGEYIAGIISNSYYVGGHAIVENNVADFKDGEFEILLIHKPADFNGYMEIASKLLNGNLDKKYMTFFQTDKIEITGDNLKWNLDGEEGGEWEKATISVEKEKLNLIKAMNENFFIRF